MPSILDQLAAHARERVTEARREIPAEALRQEADSLGPGDGAAFEAALRRKGLSFICEIKRASPSRGLISPDFPYLQLARTYEAAGADCVSCLTEPRWFLGSDAIFREVREEISLPMLRKDFTVDSYQIDQARMLGAQAVLLICAILDEEHLCRFLARCEELGLAALVETHDAAEIDMAVRAGARIIGINNRNLKDFSVDFSNAARLRDRIPPDRLCVAESGIQSPADARVLSASGADAVLVGEALMRSEDPAAFLRNAREAL